MSARKLDLLEQFSQPRTKQVAVARPGRASITPVPSLQTHLYICKSVIASFCILTFCHDCWSQSLEVHESGTGTGTMSHWETRWGSYDRDYHQTKILRITVNDVSHQGAGAKVYVYFLAEKLPQRELFIYNYAILKVNFRGGIQATDEIAAPALFMNKQNYALARSHYEYGAAMQGWIAIGRVGSRVFGKCASNQTLLATANSDALERLIVAARIKDKEDSPAPTEAPRSQSPSAASRANLQTPARRTPQNLVTLTTPVEIPVSYGVVQLPVGARLPSTVKSAATVRVIYMDAEYDVPIASTDLKISTGPPAH